MMNLLFINFYRANSFTIKLSCRVDGWLMDIWILVSAEVQILWDLRLKTSDFGLLAWQFQFPWQNQHQSSMAPENVHLLYIWNLSTNPSGATLALTLKVFMICQWQLWLRGSGRDFFCLFSEFLRCNTDTNNMFHTCTLLLFCLWLDLYCNFYTFILGLGVLMICLF